MLRNNRILPLLAVIVCFVTISGLLEVNGQLVGVEKCGKKRAVEFADCTSYPFIMRPGGHFPTNVTDGDTYCQRSKVAIKCMKQFSRNCLKSLPRQALSLLAYGINKQLRNVCKTPQSRAEIGEKMACNERNVLELNQQMAQFITDLRQIEFMEIREKLPSVCCLYHRLVAAVTRTSGAVCSPHDVDYLLTFVSSFFSDSLDLLCSSTSSDSRHCKTLQLPNKPVEGEQSNSPIPPLLMVLESL